jgi:hypothetical protein
MDKEKIKEYARILPLLTLCIYVIGFVIINGYLFKYSLVNDEFINTSFLKTGLIFTILFAPILIILYLNFEQPTDNLNIAKKYYPIFTVNILTYLLYVSIFLIDYKKLYRWEILAYILGLSIDSFTYLLATSYLFRNKKYKIKIIIQLIVPITFLIYLGIKFTYLGIFYILVIIVCHNFILWLGVVGDKKYTWGHFTSNILWFLFLAFIFGRTIYGDLPSHFGGGASVKIVLLIKQDKAEYLSKIGMTKNADVVSEVDLLYISSDKYLVHSNDKIFYLSKELFEGMISK